MKSYTLKQSIENLELGKEEQMKYKKVTWMVWYRTKSGKLSSMEVDGRLFSKEEAMREAMNKRGFKCLEMAPSGPIVKRMCYV